MTNYILCSINSTPQISETNNILNILDFYYFINNEHRIISLIIHAYNLLRHYAHLKFNLVTKLWINGWHGNFWIAQKSAVNIYWQEYQIIIFVIKGKMWYPWVKIMTEQRMKGKILLFTMIPILLMSNKDKQFWEPCFRGIMCFCEIS